MARAAPFRIALRALCRRYRRRLKNFWLAAAAEKNSGLAVFFLGLAAETEFG